MHLQILTTLSPLTSDYIWQHEPFSLSLSSSDDLPHLHGKLRYGDNLDDEWFVVFLLFHISLSFPSLSIRVWDSDGEFLLIEAAFHLPRWINPENSNNRVFIRKNEVHIIPKKKFPSLPTLKDALKLLIEHPEVTRASDSVQSAIKGRISEYPERARRNIHRVRVRVPISVAQVLRHEPCLISLAVEGFYDRDIDSMKYAANMEKFLPKGREEELVLVSVKMSRAMYAQLLQQKFQAPKCYPMPPMPPRTDQTTYTEAELGMKIACGFEMVYQHRKREGEEGKGGTWEAFRESLEKSGYFKGLLPGSKEYKQLMEKAEEYYRKSALHYRASEILSAPVKRIDEILASSHSPDDFKDQEVPSSDDDSWLYGGEEELKSDDFDLGEIAKSMKSFVQNVSSYQGAEVPDDRDLKDVEFDMDRFMKELESVTRAPGGEDDAEEGSSDMDFDESEDESDMEEPEEHGEEKQGDFMNAYTDALNEELRSSTLKKSFVRATDQSLKKDEGMSNATEDMDEDFTPVDVDVNLVKSLLDSFSSQQGLPGPASNLLGLMGKQLPQDDADKGKGKGKIL
uniref:Uncharacterized protein n=1 Tax=Chenopodium quinoa TaxID=63459 RepID=A0A803KXA9_CHEQI